MGRGKHLVHVEPVICVSTKIPKSIYRVLDNNVLTEVSGSRYLRELVIKDLKEKKLL